MATLSLQLGASVGTVLTGYEEISQAIRIIVTTPVGSVPLMPTFGNDIAPYIDRPPLEAQRLLARSTMTALRRWEPRANFLEGTAAITGSSVSLTVRWKLKDGGAVQTAVIAIDS